MAANMDSGSLVRVDREVLKRDPPTSSVIEFGWAFFKTLSAIVAMLFLSLILALTPSAV
jgi:hypothetical protein